MKKRAIGTRGSRFATVDSERLPCVHEFWWVKGDAARRYDDRLLKTTNQAIELVDAIKEKKKVVLTSDKPNSASNPIPFTRTGYISVWTVSDVEFDQYGLRFKFVEKVCDLE